MNAIVAVDNQWGIGKNNDLLFHLPVDMKFFRQKTMGKVVVMGGKTLLSFPESKPLKNRTNVVLSRSIKNRNDCVVLPSLDEIKQYLKTFPSQDIFVIGGGAFYSAMLDYCDTVFVTKVDACGEAQVFFPNRSVISCRSKQSPIGPSDSFFPTALPDDTIAAESKRNILFCIGNILSFLDARGRDLRFFENTFASLQCMNKFMPQQKTS